MYICLEGVKGSGKSTILQLLSRTFLDLGLEFAIVSPTKPVNGGWSVFEFLADRFSFLRQSDRFNECLYASRSNYVARHTNWDTPLLLGDRSIITSYVSRWRNWRDDPHMCIRRVDKLEPLIHAPDHVILLEASIDVIQKRLELRFERNYGKADETMKRISQAVQAYGEIMVNNNIPRLSRTLWYRIDAGRSVSTIYQDCYDLIQQIAPLSLGPDFSE